MWTHYLGTKNRLTNNYYAVSLVVNSVRVEWVHGGWSDRQRSKRVVRSRGGGAILEAHALPAAPKGSGEVRHAVIAEIVVLHVQVPEGPRCLLVA